MLCGAEQSCRRGGAGERDYKGGSKRTWSARLIVAYCVNTHGESGIDNKKTVTLQHVNTHGEDGRHNTNTSCELLLLGSHTILMSHVSSSFSPTVSSSKPIPPNTVWRTAFHMNMPVPIIRSRPAAGVVVFIPGILISHSLYVIGTAFR
jgi:hypothetical protein